MAHQPAAQPTITHLERLRQSAKNREQTKLTAALRQAAQIVDTIDQFLVAATAKHDPNRFEIPLAAFTEEGAAATADPEAWRENPETNALVLSFLKDHTGMDVHVGPVVARDALSCAQYFIFTEPNFNKPKDVPADRAGGLDLSSMGLTKSQVEILDEWFQGDGQIKVEAEHTGDDGQRKSGSFVLSHGTDPVTGARTLDLNVQGTPGRRTPRGRCPNPQPTAGRTRCDAPRPYEMGYGGGPMYTHMPGVAVYTCRAPPPPRRKAASTPKEEAPAASAQGAPPVRAPSSPLASSSVSASHLVDHPSVKEAAKRVADMLAARPPAGADASPPSEAGWTELSSAED